MFLNGINVLANYPLAVDGDSVYAKDVELEVGTDLNDFEGKNEHLFSDFVRPIKCETSANPKSFTIRFARPISANMFGIGSENGTTFSNAKLIFKDMGGTVRGTIDDSADATAETSKVYPFITPAGVIGKVVFIEMVVEFHTVNHVSIIGMYIPKIQQTESLIMGYDDSTGLPTYAKFDNGDFVVGGAIKLKDGDNNIISSAIPLPVADPMLAIANEVVTGVDHENKYGRAEDGIQLTATDVWDRADATPTQQIWLAPTAARIHTLVSDNAADDGTPEGAGAGAQAVRVWYLPDWDTKEATEDVILNGVAGVAMGNAAVMINRVKVIPVGSTYNINVGNITATAAVDGTVTSQVSAGEGSTLQAIYGIPSVQKGRLTKYKIGAHNTANPSTVVETDFTLLVNEHPDLNPLTFINKSNLGLIGSGTSSDTREYKPYKKITGPALIKFQAFATLADTEGTAEFDIILVDN